jgi:hypothetical protein
MTYEKCVQYTSRWYRVRVDNKSIDEKAAMIKWCHNNGSASKFHCISSYSAQFRKPDSKLVIVENLQEIRFSDNTGLMEFVLMGDFYDRS